MIVAVTIAAVMIIAAILAILAVSTARQDAHGRHARGFADPADVTDPDGARFLAELHREDPPGGYDNSPAATARLLGALRGWAVRRPDDTAPIPHAVGTWGKTVTEMLDELQAKYMEVKR